MSPRLPSLRRLALRAGLVLAALLAVQAAGAQALTTVSGTVLDAADGQPLPGATVRLIRTAPDSAVVGAAAGLDGTFRVTVAPGSYRLRVSFVGYGMLDQALRVSGPADLGRLRLSVDDAALGEAEVTAQRTRVEVRGDTTAFTADAFAVNPDANAQDLLAKMPGVVIENGTVTAQGETVQRVLVDGREFFGGDVQAALRSLPAEIVQEVQVYDRPSDAARFSGFDDGQAERTVNIVTRPGMQNGQFGRAYAGAGPGGEYLAGGNVTALAGDRRITVVGLANNVDQQNFSTDDLLGVASGGGGRGGRGGAGGGAPGGGGRGGAGGGRGGTNVSSLLVADQGGINTTNALGVSYADRLLGGRLQLTGSYVYNATDTRLAESLSRVYTAGTAAAQVYGQTDDATSANTTHRLTFRAQTDLSDRTQLVVEPRLSVQDNVYDGTLIGTTTLASGSPLARTATSTAADGLATSAGLDVLLRQRFATTGRTLTFGLGGTLGGQSTQTDLSSLITAAAGDDALDQRFDADASARSISARAEYTEPLSARSQLQLAYRPQVTWSTSNRLAFLADGTGAFTLPDAAYTSLFDQTSVVQRGGLSYRYRGDGLNAQIGVDVQNERLDAQQTASSVDRSFWSLLPSASLRFGAGEGARANIDYRVRTQTPSAAQLQDVVDTANPLLLTAGNPDLRPSTTHSVRARYTSTDAEGGSVLVGLLSGSYGQNAIVSATTLAATATEVAPGVVLPAGAQFTRPENLDGRWDARALVSYGRPVGLLRSNANVSLGTTFTHGLGLLNGAPTVSDQVGVDGRVFLGSAISPRLDVSLEYGARYAALTGSVADATLRHLAAAKLTWMPAGGLVVSTDLRALHYSGLDADVDPTQVLWGARLGYKLLPGDLAELSLSVSDLLGQQSDVERTVTDLYLQDTQTDALGRYVMLNLSYKLSNFGL